MDIFYTGKMAKKTISNWGNYPKVQAEVTAPVFVEEINSIVKSKGSIIARGNGRCYGDVSLSENILSTLKLNHITAFEKANGMITCQSGVLLSDILEFSVPRGYFLPVTPGTKFITVGGALASDVHGKNHHAEGCFSNHVSYFKLITADGNTITCSRTENDDIFWDTVGGMGRTGVIVEVTFKLKAIETSYISSRNVKVENLEEMLALFELSDSTTYSVAWLDCLKKGKQQGRGILMLGEHAKLSELSPSQAKDPLKLPQKVKLNVPLFFPKWVLNKYFVKAFNFLFYNKQIRKEQRSIIDYDKFFYPLDAILNWNRIYGKQGFTQYQFVLPKDGGEEGLKKILTTISDAGEGSFLVVLKLFGKTEPLAKWSFPMEGYTLALDFKINKHTPTLIDKLDDIVQQYGGRIYLSKDAFSRRSLSNLPPKVDSKFISLQTRRLVGSI